MTWLRPLSTGLLALGVATLAGAAMLLLLALLAPAEGLEDLGRVAGAVFLAMLAGLGGGGSLLAARAEKGWRPAAWRLAAGAAVALVSLVAVLALASAALEGPNVPLLMGIAPVALADVGGLAAAWTLRRRRPHG